MPSRCNTFCFFSDSNDSMSQAERYYSFPSREDDVHLSINGDNNGHSPNSKSKYNIGIHSSSTLEHINVGGSCKSQLSTNEDLDNKNKSSVNGGGNKLNIF